MWGEKRVFRLLKSRFRDSCSRAKLVSKTILQLRCDQLRILDPHIYVLLSSPSCYLAIRQCATNCCYHLLQCLIRTLIEWVIVGFNFDRTWVSVSNFDLNLFEHLFTGLFDLLIAINLKVNLTPVHKVVVAHTGSSFGIHLRKLRLSLPQQLLKTTDVTVGFCLVYKGLLLWSIFYFDSNRCLAVLFSFESHVR